MEGQRKRSEDTGKEVPIHGGCISQDVQDAAAVSSSPKSQVAHHQRFISHHHFTPIENWLGLHPVYSFQDSVCARGETVLDGLELAIELSLSRPTSLLPMVYPSPATRTRKVRLP